MEITVDALKDDRLLSAKAIEMYTVRLNRLQEITQHNLEWIMLHPIETIKAIKSKVSTNPMTIANFLTVICKMYSQHAQFANVHKTENGTYLKYLKHYRKEELNHYKDNEFTEKQVKNLVTWQELQDHFCKMQHNPLIKQCQKYNQEYLLFAFFLNMHPKRADYGRLAIYKAKPTAAATGNYILLAPKQSTLVLNEYKTAKYYGTIKEPMPDTLVSILKESLELFPRDYVFVTSESGSKPYENNNSYSQYVKRVFKKHFNRAMGVSLWRSVYIAANLDFQEDSGKALDKAAHYIGHSQSTLSALYRKTGPLAKAMRRTDDEKKQPVTCQKPDSK
jgi:hypothetical protein